MPYKYWHQRKCSFCELDTSMYCDGCGKPICERQHTKTLSIAHNKTVSFCPLCTKKLAPGIKIGGYRITEEALNGKYGGWK